MKTKIWIDNKIENNHVSIVSDEMTTIVWVPRNGGYVRFNNNNQVCDGLMTRGDTLSFKKVEGDNFLKFIRKQWRKRQRLMKKNC
jgi:hypothetical protein